MFYLLILIKKLNQFFNSASYLRNLSNYMNLSDIGYLYKIFPLKNFI